MSHRAAPSSTHTGDDGFAIWSAGVSETNVTFKDSLATFPRYPKTWLASCFAQYGGNRTAFLGNRCVGTGERGMIFFRCGKTPFQDPGPRLPWLSLTDTACPGALQPQRSGLAVAGLH